MDIIWYDYEIMNYEPPYLGHPGFWTTLFSRSFYGAKIYQIFGSPHTVYDIFSVSILAFRVGTVTAMSVLQRFCRVSEERKELGTANCIPFAPNLIDNEVIIRANNSKCNIMRLSENWYHSSWWQFQSEQWNNDDNLLVFGWYTTF